MSSTKPYKRHGKKLFQIEIGTIRTNLIDETKNERARKFIEQNRETQT